MGRRLFALGGARERERERDSERARERERERETEREREKRERKGNRPCVYIPRFPPPSLPPSPQMSSRAARQNLINHFSTCGTISSNSSCYTCMSSHSSPESTSCMHFWRATFWANSLVREASMVFCCTPKACRALTFALGPPLGGCLNEKQVEKAMHLLSGVIKSRGALTAEHHSCSRALASSSSFASNPKP